jgi:predicted acylesterase/phospholipase RssA
MKRLGLALSGGGFRASLYHLGLLRFLRDAGILSQVTHITSVSGGSIMGAHLALNWDRYSGGAEQFDAAAAEVLAFVRLDVRNRIARRFPLTIPLRWPLRLLGRSSRKLSRTGLLEYHYERYLYGDKSLFELPESPQLHILATNLSEGCLCSFHRDGILMVRRQADGGIRVDRVQAGLATVAMAVTASSAFPGFFPPLELTGAEVGAGGEFGRQSYTDGGVFDNLGVRMFHCLERPMLAESPLGRDDFVDFPAAVEALTAAVRSPEETALRRLAHILAGACRQPGALPPPNGTGSRGAPPAAVATDTAASVPQLATAPAAGMGDSEEALLSGLGNVMRHYPFGLEPLFAGLKVADPHAETLLRGRRTPGPADQVWLNRHLVEAAFRQATGRPCFRRLNSGLDAVLVSDVGKRIEVLSRRAGGLIRTALRSTDILMDRVWQLETETFRDAAGFVFAPITEVVEPADDPTALHPEVQRQVARIRTDLDRFSPLEISSLARHGYAVCRRVCRANPDLFGDELPRGAPWDPLAAPTPDAKGVPPERVPPAPGAATTDARVLRASALRRIWGAFLDRRDWVSYLYLPILVALFVLLPYFAITSYQRARRLSNLVQSFSQGTRDLETLNALLEGKPMNWSGEAAEQVDSLPAPDLKGFQILQDSRIIDLREWRPGVSGARADDSVVFVHHRLKVVKVRDNTKNPIFAVHLLPTDPKSVFHFPDQELRPKLRMCNAVSSATGPAECRFEARFDFQGVPPDQFVDLTIEDRSPGHFLERGQSGSAVTFLVEAETAELTMWLVMPKGKNYRKWHMSRHQTDKPENSESVPVVTEYLADDFSILAFKLLGVNPGWTYVVNWNYE